MAMERRVVVTGIGLCTPLGNGREPTFTALCAGKSGIGPIGDEVLIYIDFEGTRK